MKANVVNKPLFNKPAPARLQVAHSAFKNALRPKPNYFIERVVALNDEVIDVFFIDTVVLESGIINEEDWKFVRIKFSDLEAFAIDAFRDTRVASDVTNYDFINDSLHVVTKAFLDAGKGVKVD